MRVFKLEKRKPSYGIEDDSVIAFARTVQSACDMARRHYHDGTDWEDPISVRITEIGEVNVIGEGLFEPLTS